MLGFEVESVWPPDRPNYVHFKSSGGANAAVVVGEARWPRAGSGPLVRGARRTEPRAALWCFSVARCG
jgi:hypothetical protein